MSLLEILNTIKIYLKKCKKSISLVFKSLFLAINSIFLAFKSASLATKIDICIIISLFALLLSPVIYSLFSTVSANIRQKDVFITSNFEELFGKETTEAILQSFMKDNPDIKIKLIDANSKEKNREPDIFINEENDGQSLTLVSFMDLLFYNIELLKTAGFDRPPKNREEFLYYAKTVSKDGKVSGAAMSLGPGDKTAVSRDIFSWMWASGGDFWPKPEEEEPLKTNESSEVKNTAEAAPAPLIALTSAQAPVINTKPLVRDIAFFGSLYSDEALAPSVFDATGERRLEEFAQGKIAMMIASTRAIACLREKMGDDAFGITVIPVSGSPLNYNICLSGIYAGVNADSEYVQEARSFLKYLEEQRPLLCAELKAVPGIASDLFSGDYIKDDPFYLKARSIFESSHIVQDFSQTAAAKNYEDAVREELKIFFESGRSAEETALAIQRRWEIIKEQ